MAGVLLDMAISLDGLICGPGGADGGLYDWYFDPSDISRPVVEELAAETGAIIIGRRIPACRSRSTADRVAWQGGTAARAAHRRSASRDARRQGLPSAKVIHVHISSVLDPDVYLDHQSSPHTLGQAATPRHGAQCIPRARAGGLVTARAELPPS